jgi:predicted RNase H-like nuclease
LIGKCFGADVVDRVRAEHRAKDVGTDDIYDAFAALWTAQRICQGQAVVIPNPAPVDSTGLPMGIWY